MSLTPQQQAVLTYTELIKPEDITIVVRTGNKEEPVKAKPIKEFMNAYSLLDSSQAADGLWIPMGVAMTAIHATIIDTIKRMVALNATADANEQANLIAENTRLKKELDELLRSPFWQ